MSLNKVNPGARIASSFKQLAESSSDLNSAGDELCEVICAVETTLISISPKVAAWHTIASGGDDNGWYWHRDIGYAKVGKVWGIAIRTVREHDAIEHDEIETWIFKDAPRWMQIESVGKIPDLFDALIKRTQETAEKLRAKTVEARQLARALSDAVAELDEHRKLPAHGDDL
jgi:hypothetical protein